MGSSPTKPLPAKLCNRFPGGIRSCPNPASSGRALAKPFEAAECYSAQVTDEHVTRDLFRAISGGWRNPGDLAAIALAHLFELCPRCRREFQSWRRELGEGVPAAGPHDYEAVLVRFRARAAPKPANSNEAPGALDARAAAEEREARSRAEELLRLSPAEQAELVRREPERFAGLLLAEMLIEDSRKKAPDRPKEAATHARLARLVLHHTPLSAYAGELYVRALAYLANAIRVIGDLPRADQILGDARYFFRALGCGDRLVRAELDRLEGTLRVGQLRIEAAVSVLLRAQMVYRLENQPRMVAGTILTIGRAHERRGAADMSLKLVGEVERILDDAPDPRLSRIAYANRVGFLCTTGDLGLAMSLAQDLKDGHQERDLISKVRNEWTVAKIYRKAGNTEEAVKGLSSVREAFSSRDFFYDKAVVSLELADLLAQQAQPEEVQHLVAEVVPVFRKLDLPTRVAEAETLARRAASS